MKYEIESIKTQLEQALKAVQAVNDLEHVRTSFIGRKGLIAGLMHTLKDLPLEEKRIYGPLLNDLKQHCSDRIAHAEQSLQQALSASQQHELRYFDVTASRVSAPQGSLHVYSHIIQLLEDIFISMGYTIVDGPEVETEYYNFEALNVPVHHPARDMQDTFWLNVPGMLLRTHTTTMQLHAMQQHKSPMAMFSSGRVYRNEATDASHDFMFMQADCLFIDTDVSIAHLLATARIFLRTFFGNDTITLRVRPGYFPFVEPGLEIDASCPFCKSGCSLCKYTGWIELLGSGLVHPSVLRAGGIDPDIYTGFAFGCGIERLAMIKYGIGDIRLFRTNKCAFLEQF
jgi:phenylalanyl-tRNA synthetase alpha chain